MANKRISELSSRTPSATDLMLVGDPTTGYSYKCLVSQVGGVTSVFGRTGAVTAQEGDYSLTSLSDVTITGPASGDILTYNGSSWVNSAGGFVPYTGATQNVSLGEYGILAGWYRLDTTPTGTPTNQGTIYWDNSFNTAAIIMNGTTQEIGHDQFYQAKNSTGSTIPKGTAVRFAGTDGGSGHLLIAPFLADGSNPSSYFMGVTAEAITNGSFGKVQSFGRLDGIDTSAFAEGDLLYCSNTVAGGFQTTVPQAPNNIILVAAVISDSNNGKILIRPTLGSKLSLDESVRISSPTNGQVLQYNSSLAVWQNVNASSLSVNNIYTADGTLTGNRTVTLGGNTLNFTGGNVGILQPTPITRLDIGGHNSNAASATVSVMEYTSLGNISIGGYGAVGSNYWIDNGTLRRRRADVSSAIHFNNGGFDFLNAASGTVNSTITYTTYGRIFGSGAAAGIFVWGQTINASGEIFQITGNSAVGRAAANGVAYAAVYNAGAGFVTLQQRDGTNSRYGINGMSELTSSGTGGLAIVSASGAIHFGTSAAEMMRIFTTGNIGINTTTDAGYRLDVNGTFRNVGFWFLNGSGQWNGRVGNAAAQSSGAAVYLTLNGHGAQIQDQTAVNTTFYSTLDSFPSIAAATSVTALSHFSARNGALGAGASVTTQTGIDITALTLGSTIYGIRSQVASATNRWNLYLNGTAANYIEGSLGIGTTSPTYKLHVVGTGRITGNVELSVDSGAYTIIGATGDTTYRLSVDGDLRVYGSVRTANPSGGTSTKWRLGSYAAATVQLDTGGYLEVEVNGTAYKVGLVMLP